MQALDSIIDQVKSLPPAPRILPELLAVLRRDDADASEIVRLITFDPALTAQVLRRCNSAQYGFAEPVRDLQNAVVRIGMGEVYRIVANLVGERTLGAPQRGYGIGQGELWKHCAVTAVAARLIAHELQGDESVVFTAALLHDIGKLVLSTLLEGAYTEVIAKTENSELSFLEAEKAILGVDHAEVGGRLLERWNFPPNLVRAVWQHHDPLQARPDEHLAAYVHLGDVLAHMLGHGYGHQAYAVRYRAEALDLLEVTSRDLEQFLIKTSGSVEEIIELNSMAQ
jgi:putative nucleotidyltransferase with HDIG domain